MKKGYTLIEFAIVLSVVGIFVASFSHFYKIYITQQRYEKTVDAQRKVNWAISSYLVQNGRYPCPARLDAAREDADYGLSGECEAGKAGYPAVSPGECGAGICIEESGRTGITSKVRRGAVPFRTIGLPEDFSIDGYAMRLQYAVTEDLAVSDTYDKRGGGIDVVDASNASILGADAAAGAHYVVFSSGEDRSGAYSRYGKLYQACTASSDGENCNTGPSGDAKKAIYRSASTSKGIGAGYYDDMMQFSTAAETPLWRVADEDGRHLNDMLDEDEDQVSIGGTTPSDDEDVKVNVVGGMNVSEKIRADNIAQPEGDQGFDPAIVAAEDGPLKCGAGYATSFEAGQVKCEPIQAVKCKANEMITGIDASGNVQCATYISCPAQTENGCNGDTFTLPPGARGDKANPYGVSTDTVSYHPVYECMASGKWEKHSSSTGSCDVCVPSDTTTNVSCNSKAPSGGNWTGTVSVRRIVECPDNKVTETIVGASWAASCTCANKTENRTISCPSDPWKKTYQRRNWTCTNATSGSWSGWQTIAGESCIPPKDCNAQESRYKACDAPYSGGWTQKRNRNCTTGQYTSDWGPATAPGGACTCDANKKETMQKGCVPPLVGTVYMERKLNCGTTPPTWGSWKEVSSSCGMKVLKWKRGGTQSPGRSGPEAGSICSKAGETSPCYEPIGSSYHTYASCMCQ